MTCSYESHQAMKSRPDVLDRLRNLRRWDDAEAWCGECECGSTILVPYRPEAEEVAA